MSQNKNEWEELNRKEKLLKSAAQILSVSDKDLLRVVERFQKEIEELKSRQT